MPIILGFMAGFFIAVLIIAVFVKPAMKLLRLFVLYVLLPLCFGVVLFALFFALKARSKNAWLDFGLLLFILALYASSIASWCMYFLAYFGILVLLAALMLGIKSAKMLFERYKKYKNSQSYIAKKLQKEKEKFDKNYKKTENLIENVKNKALAKTSDEKEIENILCQNISLKNAFIFLADRHKIIINKRDMKTIAKITEFFALPKGEELMRYESAYKEILARHKQKNEM